jgi:hypothetical protein
MAKKRNVCYFHRQEDNKWQWFIVDEHGRAIIKSTDEFNTYEEVSKDYEHHGHTLEVKLLYVPLESITTVNGKPIG